MLVILYGEANFASRAWKEMDTGQPVALKIIGRQRHVINKTLSLYAEYDQLLRERKLRKWLLISLAWRTLLSPSFVGLCNHARSVGMAVTAFENKLTLEVRFEKPTEGYKKDVDQKQ